MVQLHTIILLDINNGNDEKIFRMRNSDYLIVINVNIIIAFILIFQESSLCDNSENRITT